jgi:xanthine dehydrogenase accessory factor
MATEDSLPMPRTAAPDEVLSAALDRIGSGGRVILATVLRRKGSTPSTPGQKLALLSLDEAVGTVGGGAVEQRVLIAMRAALAGREAEPQLLHYDLGATLGMCCGGSVEILLEVLEPALAVLVVGAGHVGCALAPLLAQLGFAVLVADARESMPGPAVGSRLRFVHAEHDDPEIEEALASPARAAALVMTHDHQLDQAAVEWALKKGFGFVGGVGSLAKAARTRVRLEARGFEARDIERLRMPVGVDIAARLPLEIAVSIAGELVRWRSELLGTDRRQRKVRRSVDEPVLAEAGK